MRRSTAVLLMLLSGLFALAAQAEEDGIHSCQQSNGNLFFTNDPKYFPANCQPMERKPSRGGLILVPDSALPDELNKMDSPNGPWRIEDWRLQRGERTAS
jgi:hypothetical protein